MVGEAKGAGYVEKHSRDQIVAGTYRTQHFEQSPQAQLLYTSLPKKTNPADAEKAAIYQDQLFALEKKVISTGRSTPEEVKLARDLEARIMHMANIMDLGAEHAYIKKSVDRIENSLDLTGNVVDSGSMDLNKEFIKRFFMPPYSETPEKRDMDIDNTKFLLSRNLKAQRKLKIIDND